MTVTDHLTEEDLLLLTEPEPGRAKDRSELPPGAEAMARPWRLGVVGVGITVGLVARLLAANGYFSINSRTLVYAAALTSLLVGVGLIAVAAERDRFDRWMLLLAGGTGLSLGALQWVSPNFASGTLEWSNADQVGLAILGVANGVVLAGVLTLAFVRRWPTMTVVGLLAAGVLALAADSVLLRNEWPSIAALALAFGGVLLAWDQAPRHEPTYPDQTASPRISRAALSLATVAIGGSVIQLWISRGESVRRILPAGIVSAALVLLAFLAMIRIRREIQRRETSMNEWTSWMREIRTGDLRNDFETMGTTASGGVIGDVTGEAPRALSFPDLRVDEQPPAAALSPTSEAEGQRTDKPVAAAQGVGIPEVTTAETSPVAPAIDVPDVAAAVGLPLPDTAPPTIPVADVPGDTLPGVPADAAPAQPRLFGDELPAAAELVWADDHEEPTVDTPIVSEDQPSLFDVERQIDAVGPLSSAAAAPVSAAPAIPLPPSLVTPVVDAAEAPTPIAGDLAPPAASSSFSDYLTEPTDEIPVVGLPEAAPAPAPTPAPALSSTGAFSSWLDATQVATVVGTIDDFAAWLATSPTGTDRLVAAVETMSLADFDELPTEVSGAANSAMLERLSLLLPQPGIVATIDGPYLMVAWNDIANARLTEVNRTILDAMATPVPTEHGAVGLTGTLALLRPADGSQIDDVIDQAIQGLVQARKLEALAAEPR